MYVHQTVGNEEYSRKRFLEKKTQYDYTITDLWLRIAFNR